MFENQKARTQVDRIFELAEATAMLPMPFPTYNEEVRFELLFIFFFLLDYREYVKFGGPLRTKILDEFVRRVAEELDGGASVADSLYDRRIGIYYAIMQRTKTVRDFLEPVSDYIETTALYALDTGRLPVGDASMGRMESKITSPLRGRLKEPIAMSIAMHAQGLL